MSRTSVLNYHHAELLFHVLRSRTLTDAARALHISQPAVTKQIKSLEASLGVQLFQKEGRNLIPTAEALQLVDEVERTRASLASLNELAARLKSGETGNLVICAIPAFAQALLPGAIGAFRTLYPKIRVEVKVENSWRLLDLAEAQQIDFGICYRYRELIQVDDAPLLNSGIVCVVRADDPLASVSERSLAELCGRPLVVVEVFGANATIKELLTASKLDQDIISVVSTSTLACEIVLKTGAIALIDSVTAVSYQSRGLAVLALPELPIRTISLLRPKLRPGSLFAETLGRTIIEEAALFGLGAKDPG